jgi:hypothetical protein
MYGVDVRHVYGRLRRALVKTQRQPKRKYLSLHRVQVDAKCLAGIGDDDEPHPPPMLIGCDGADNLPHGTSAQVMASLANLIAVWLTRSSLASA